MKLAKGKNKITSSSTRDANDLVKQGVALGMVGKTAEAITVFDDIVTRFGSSGSIEIQTIVAKALVNKVIALEKEGKTAEAIIVFDDIVTRFGSSGSIEIQTIVASVLVNKGIVLGKEGKTAEAIIVFDDIVTRFGSSGSIEIQTQVANALVNKGVALEKEGKTAEAIIVFDDIVTRHGSSGAIEIQTMVAKALVYKGVILSKEGKTAEATTVFDHVVARFGSSDAIEIQTQIARALVNKGIVLAKEGKTAEAIIVFDDIVTRFGSSDAIEIQTQVVISFFDKGVALEKEGKTAEAIIVFDDIVTRFGSSGSIEIQTYIAKALVYKGVILSREGKTAEAIIVFDDIVTRFGSSDSLKIHSHVAKAFFGKGVTLARQGKITEASIACDNAIARLSNLTDEVSKEIHQRILLFKSIYSKDMRETDQEEGSVSKARELDPTSAVVQEFNALSRHKELSRELSSLLVDFDRDKRQLFKREMIARDQRAKNFLRAETFFRDDISFLLILREWNSYTPIVPDMHEVDRGGGYFIRHYGKGIVIDPGYDFIENFWRAGGRIHDIDAIIITHAHDDHTSDFEAILTLLFKYNGQPGQKGKRIKLYLSMGAQTKLTTFFSLRNDSRISRVVTLNPCVDSQIQRVDLFDDVTLTVMPAYHDDVVTENSSVGLCLTLKMKNAESSMDNVRHIIFTGDTSLYPMKSSELSEGLHSERSSDLLDPEMSLDVRYLKILDVLNIGTIDLIVPHLGSIKEYELDGPTLDPDQPLFYPNHLGLHGLAMLLNRLAFRLAIVSEFGEELKDIRRQIAEIIGKALKNENKFLVPGDITLVYDIDSRKLLCHRTCDFRDPHELEVIDDAVEEEKIRIYLIGRDGAHARIAKDLIKYHKHLDEKKLPHFRKLDEHKQA